MIELSNGGLGKLPRKLSPEKLYVMKEIITEQESGEIPGKLFCMDRSDVITHLPSRKEYSHKGSYGKLLIVAGSKDMAGAAYLSAKAAYRIGAGLVKIVTPEENRIILQQLIPEAVLSSYQGKPDVEQLLHDISWASTILIGPGLGQNENAEFLTEFVLTHASCPIIVDADALNISARKPGLLKNYQNEIAITPHFAEMSRLYGTSIDYIRKNFFLVAEEYAKENNVICHLKHVRSITACPDGNLYWNLTGNNGMSTAGSGDVLSGIIAGLSAQKITLRDSVIVGAFIHGDSGDEGAKMIGTRALMASDIILNLTKLEYLK